MGRSAACDAAKAPRSAHSRIWDHRVGLVRPRGVRTMRPCILGRSPPSLEDRNEATLWIDPEAVVALGVVPGGREIWADCGPVCQGGQAAEQRAAETGPRHFERDGREIRDATPSRRGQQERNGRIERELRHVDCEPPVEPIVAGEVAVTAQAVGAGRVAGVRMGMVGQPVMEFVRRRLRDHFQQFPHCRRRAEVRGIACAILQRVAKEDLAGDGAERRVFLAADAGLQLIVLNVEINGRGAA